VQDDVGHVLDDARHALELVQRALDLAADDGRAAQRAQEEPPERVAEGDAEAALERLGHEAAELRSQGLVIDLELLRADELTPVAVHHTDLPRGFVLVHRTLTGPPPALSDPRSAPSRSVRDVG